MKIWIIGGTADSRCLVQAITSKSFASYGFDFVVSVTTPEAQNLYGEKQKVSVGKLNRSQMEQFCHCHKIAIIVDTSHPFALEVSQNAIATAKSLHIPYLRYERAELATTRVSQTSDNQVSNHQNIRLASFEQLLEGNYLNNHRVLLTVGCQVLLQFKSWQTRTTLFARILPKLDSLRMALDAGFSSDRLIALRPPYSEELEVALWQKWQISLVVTKASGQAGGEDLKQKVANSLNIPLITIARPKLAYPQVTSSISELITFLKTLSSSRNLNS